MRHRILRLLTLPLFLSAFALLGLGAAPAREANAAVNCYATIGYFHHPSYGQYYIYGGYSCSDADNYQYGRSLKVTIFYQSGGPGGPWYTANYKTDLSWNPTDSIKVPTSWGYCTNGQAVSEFWDEFGTYHSIWTGVSYLCP